jgi:hypothetical protein
MITAKQAYAIAKEWMGPCALVSSGYEIDTHFIFLREHNRGKLWTDHASFWIDKSNGELKIVSAIPKTKEFDMMQQGKQLNLAEIGE